MGKVGKFAPREGHYLFAHGQQDPLAIHKMGQDVDEGPPCRGKDLLAWFQFLAWGELILTIFPLRLLQLNYSDVLALLFQPVPKNISQSE